MDEIRTFIGNLRGQMADANAQVIDDPKGVAEHAADQVGFYGYGSRELAILASQVDSPTDCYKVLIECLAALPKLAEMPRESSPSPTPLDAERALSVAEVAKILGVGKGTVYKLCSEQRMPHNRIGDRITITREQLAEFQRSQ